MVKNWSYSGGWQVRATMRSRLSEECINMVEACRPWITDSSMMILVIQAEWNDRMTDRSRDFKKPGCNFHHRWRQRLIGMSVDLIEIPIGPLRTIEILDHGIRSPYTGVAFHSDNVSENALSFFLRFVFTPPRAEEILAQAIEFTRKLDDGRQPELWNEAATCLGNSAC